MTVIGTAYGASPLTFLGLAGVGDLFLTCSSSNSRNYTVGYRLGRGEKLDEIIKTLGSVAEGVETAKGVKKIIDELGVRAPIATAVGLIVVKKGMLFSLLFLYRCMRSCSRVIRVNCCVERSKIDLLISQVKTHATLSKNSVNFPHQGSWNSRRQRALLRVGL